MFRKEDIAQIEQRGSSVQTVEQQVERFKQGFPWMNSGYQSNAFGGVFISGNSNFHCSDTGICNCSIFNFRIVCAFKKYYPSDNY